MTGSVRWYKYIDDRDNTWGVLLDETTASTPSLGFEAVTTGDDLDQLPRGHKMRWVNATKLTGGGGQGFVQSQFPVAKLEATAWTGTNTILTVGGSTYAITSLRGEQRRLVIASNTGQTGPTP